MNQRSSVKFIRSFVLIGILCVAAANVQADQVDYTGHKVVRVFPRSWDQIEAIHALGALLLSEAEGIGPVDYVIAPETMAGLEAIGVEYNVLNDDVQTLIDEERARLAARGPADPRDPAWFLDYKNLDAVNAKLSAMATDRPDLVTLLDIGTTLQGRPIYGVRITGPGANKPAVQFNGCHHAREWISVMVPMWIADRFVYEYDTNASIHSIVDRVEFFIIPVVNLDGYVYSWTTDRLWRKNRRLNAGGCYGVDDNRNYATAWGGGGSSSNPCSEIYRGTAAFSEPETGAMRDFAVARPQIVATQSYHSYSQLFMSPWGYIVSLPPDNPTFLEVDAASTQAIAAVHGMSYGYGPIYSTIYQASGNDVDWYYAAEGIFSFVTELRDTGQYGFLLPADQIIPTCEENFAAAMYLAEWASNPVKFSFPNGRPSRIDPNTPTDVLLRITVIGGTLDANSPRLWARLGDSGPFTQYTLTPGLDDLFTATLPATPCGRTLKYYFSAATTTGTVGYSPGDAPATLYSATAAPIALLLDQPMNANPGWTISGGQWAWGQPTGGGSYNHDPASGYTGSYVYGYNLSGDYANNIPAYYLTMPVINCSGNFGVKLDFYRWLGVESNSNYDQATIEATNDGTTWAVIWRAADTGAAVSDSSWQHVTYDLSAVADNRANVRIRWGMGPTDVAVTYPGWNIDDVKVWGSQPTTCAGVSFGPGDVNQDGAVNGPDIAAFVDVLLNPGSATNPELCCADVNGDCAVNTSDIAPFVNLLLAP